MWTAACLNIDLQILTFAKSVVLYGICQLPNSQIHSQYHWEALASLKIAISSSTGTGNGFVSWTTVIKIIIHSKKFWTANGRPMFGQQTDIDLPTQPFVH